MDMRVGSREVDLGFGETVEGRGRRRVYAPHFAYAQRR